MYHVCSVCVCVHVRVCVWWAVLCSSYKLYTCEIVSQIGDHSAVIHKRPLNDEGVNRSEPRLQGTMRTGAPKLIQMHTATHSTPLEDAEEVMQGVPSSTPSRRESHQGCTDTVSLPARIAASYPAAVRRAVCAPVGYGLQRTSLQHARVVLASDGGRLEH